MKKQKQYMTPDEARRIFRKRKPSGYDVGRLYIYIQVNQLLTFAFENPNADVEIYSADYLNKLAVLKTHVFAIDGSRAGIDPQSETLAEFDCEMMYTHMKTNLQTSLQEFWKAETLCSEALNEFKNLYNRIIYDCKSELFELSKERTDDLFSNFHENLESHVYYVHAVNHSMDLLSDRYLIDLSALKNNVEDLQKAVSTVTKGFNILISATAEKSHKYTEIISKIAEQCGNLDFEKLIAIDPDRERKAQLLLLKRLPFASGEDLNTTLCVWRRKE